MTIYIEACQVLKRNDYDSKQLEDEKMKKKLSQYIGLVAVSILLVACGDTVASDQESQSSMSDLATESYENQIIEINGLADHYHTGDPV